jgi:hypothetical protein
VVGVEGQPYGNTAPRGVRERARNEARRRLLEIEVIESEIERLLRA